MCVVFDTIEYMTLIIHASLGMILFPSCVYYFIRHGHHSHGVCDVICRLITTMTTPAKKGGLTLRRKEAFQDQTHSVALEARDWIFHTLNLPIENVH
jgi:hypothetical protein